VEDDMVDLRRRFGRLVAASRRRAGMTQETLAEAADVSVDMISKIEVGASGARFPVIERLAAALHVDPAEFFSTEIRTGRAAEDDVFADLTARLWGLPEAELYWLSDLIDAALRPKIGKKGASKKGG